MKAEGGGQVRKGTRVDCLFGDEYFRGEVDDTDCGGSSYRVIIFDDGDIREDAPPEDLELPLEQGCRVECMFEGEDGYFDGVISIDNGDATYKVDFDDGDVLDAAPRHDIRVLSWPHEESAPSHAVTAEDSNTNVAEQEGKDFDTRYSDRSHNKAESEENREVQKDDKNSTGVSAAHGELPPGEETHDSPHQSQRSSEVDGSEDGYGRAGDEPARISQHGSLPRRNSKQRDKSDTSNSDSVINNYGDNGVAQERDCDFGLDIRSRVKETLSSTRRGEKDLGSSSGEPQRRHDGWTGRELSGTPSNRNEPTTQLVQASSLYVPTSPNPLHAHLEALAAAAPRLLAEAPPDFRLSAISHRIAALEEQLRQQEARGEAWHLPVFSAETPLHPADPSLRGRPERQGRSDPEQATGSGGEGSPRATTARGGAAAPLFPAHAELRKVAEDLSMLRMKQARGTHPDFSRTFPALLCYGDASLEMVQAIADLADGYAKEALWPQASNSIVSNHIAKAADILARDKGSRFPGDRFFITATPGGGTYVDPRLRFEGHSGLRANEPRGGCTEGQRARGLAFPTENRYSDPALCRSLTPARSAHLLLELLKGLRLSVVEGGERRQVERENFEVFLSTHKDKALRSARHRLLLEAQIPSNCGWGAALGCLRRNSPFFADLNLKIMEGVQQKQAAKVRLAFQAVDPDGTGCAEAEALLSELHARFSRNDGNLLEAVYPDLLSAVADLVPGSSPDGAAQDELRKTLGPEQNHATPITWEEILALLVADDEEEKVVEGGVGAARQRLRSLLHVRVQTLTGRCETHTNRLSAACRNLSEALAELERLGLGEASGSVPVLNALTDALALTHRRHQEMSSIKAKKLAETWIQGKEGQDLWKQECKRLVLECRRRLEVVPRAEIEERTWEALVAYRSKILTRELGGKGKELDTAEDYLVRAWEILESRHGRNDPDVGAACISLGNLAIIRRRLNEAIDWFRRALGTFEECFRDGYTPVTASTAVALGNLLIKQGAAEAGTRTTRDSQALGEATGLMEKAATFYSERVTTAAERDRSAFVRQAAEDAFAWSDSDPAGSRLDPQTADFARRSAELWTQVAGMRELAVGHEAGHQERSTEDADVGTLADALEQAARSTSIARGPCSAALGRLCRRLGEVLQ
ncbi:unnamed protein product, partial [Ectocarpus sp. 12 AP-2014]